jgi:hypothetical protein
MNKLVIIFILLYLIFPFSTVFAGDQKNESFMYYWEKGNKGEIISFDEFNFLINKLEKDIKDLQNALFKIHIEDANFSYKNGKFWEIQLETAKEQLELSLKYLAAVKKLPNIITPSLAVYVNLRDTLESAYEFSEINVFEKILNDKHISLSMWCKAFLKAHLFPLAMALDKNKKLYK